MCKRWKIRLEFEGGMEQLTGFSLSDIGTYIKKHKKRSHKTLPIIVWLIDMVFDKATSICSIEELVSATIFQED